MRLTVKAALASLASVTLVAAAPVAEGGRKFGPIALTPEAERPNPGVPGASGNVVAFINVGQDRVCWELVVNGVNPITAAHIHEGGPEVAGPIRVSFFHFGQAVDLEGCTTGTALHPIDRELLRKIIQNPQNFYVNVHSSGQFMGGAIRGQLAK